MSSVGECRWFIMGSLVTESPLCLRDTEVRDPGELEELRDGGADEDDSAAADEAAANTIRVASDVNGRPVLPARRLRGALLARLRSFRQQNFSEVSDALAGVIGSSGMGSRLRCRTASVRSASLSGDLIEQRSSVAMNRLSGTAASGLLRTTEYVPAGVAFALSLEVSSCSEHSVSGVLALLEEFNRDDDSELTLGMNRSDGWGRMRWSLMTVRRVTAADMRAMLDSHTGWRVAPSDLPTVPHDHLLKIAREYQTKCAPHPIHVSIRGTLATTSPLLISADASGREGARDPLDGRAENGDPREHLPDRLRGVLRSHAEQLLRSIAVDGASSPAMCVHCYDGPSRVWLPGEPLASDPGQACLICLLFGGKGRHPAVELRVNYRRSDLEQEQEHTQHARDRFTRYPSRGSLRSPRTADGVEWQVGILINLRRLFQRFPSDLDSSHSDGFVSAAPQVQEDVDAEDGERLEAAASLLLATIDDLECGYLSVGGKSAIGWGTVELRDRQAVLPRWLADHFARRTAPGVPWLVTAAEALGSSKRTYSDCDSRSTMLRVLWKACGVDSKAIREESVAGSSFLASLHEQNKPEHAAPWADQSIPPIAIPNAPAFIPSHTYVPAFSVDGLDSIEATELDDDGSASLFSGFPALRHDRYDTEAFQATLRVRGVVETNLAVGVQWVGSDEAGNKCLAIRDNAIAASSLRGLLSSEHEVWTGSALRVLDDLTWSRRRPARNPERIGPSVKSALPFVGVVERVEGTSGEHVILPLACGPLMGNLALRNDELTVVCRREVLKLFGETSVPLRVYLRNRQLLAKIRNEDWWTARESRSNSTAAVFRLPINRAAFELTLGAGGVLTSNRYSKVKPRPGEVLRGLLWGAKYMGAAEPALVTNDERTEHGVAGRLLVMFSESREAREPSGALALNKKYEIFLPFPAEGVERARVAIPRGVEDAFNGMLYTRSGGPRGRGISAPYSEISPPYLPLGRHGDARLATGDLIHFDVELVQDKPIVTAISYSSWWRYPFKCGACDRPTVHAGFSVLPKEPGGVPVRSPFFELLPMHPWRRTLSASEQLFGFVMQGGSYRVPGNVPDDEQHLLHVLPAYASRIRVSTARVNGTVASVQVPPMYSPSPSPQLALRKEDGSSPVTNSDYRIGTSFPRGTKEPIRRVPMSSAEADPKWPWMQALAPGSSFEFDISLRNASIEELAAICHSLSPSESYRHMMGYGTPVGFGRCRLEVQAITIDDPLARHHPDPRIRAKSSVSVDAASEIARKLASLHRSQMETGDSLKESARVKRAVGENVGVDGVKGPEAAEELYPLYLANAAAAELGRQAGLFRVVQAAGQVIPVVSPG